MIRRVIAPLVGGATAFLSHPTTTAAAHTAPRPIPRLTPAPRWRGGAGPTPRGVPPPPPPRAPPPRWWARPAPGGAPPPPLAPASAPRGRRRGRALGRRDQSPQRRLPQPYPP